MVLSSSKLKFACNIATLFSPSITLMDRLKSAKNQGFTSIEVAFPYTWSLEEWKDGLSKHPLDVVLINTPLGPEGQPGLAACQNKEVDFLTGVERGIEYCNALGCSLLHVMAGNEVQFEGQFEVFVYQMRRASDLMKKSGICGLIETISEGVIPGYYLNDAKKTIELVDDICCDNIFFQFDVFHLSMLGFSDGEIISLFDRNFHIIKHVQVAQTPGRNQVDMVGGVDYTNIFNHLVYRNYGGFIGLEYKPIPSDDIKSTNKTLEFLSKF